MNSLTTYANGTVAELPNKKISIEDCEGTFVIEIKNVGKEFSQPCVIHDFKEGVRTSTIKLSEETMNVLVQSYIEYKNNLNEPSVGEVVT